VPRFLLVSAVAASFVLSACGDNGGGGGTGASSAPATTTTAETAGGCRQVAQPRPRPDGGQKKPKKALENATTYELEISTNCGDFSFRLDLKAAPHASASLVSLAKAGFFDGTVFHRIVPDFVIQGGDPTGTGMGGPGYKTVDKPPSDARYTKGVVAMAKAENERAGTAGSQFYVVTAADAQLPPEYALVGKVVSGLDVVERIGQLGDPASGQTGTPTQPVVIKSVKVKTS
jgi:peptidyl-prolyl cis-trans isomerase B (cyclophilin B)